MDIRVQVSDGKDISDPHILYVSAVPLSITLQVNTGNLLYLFKDQMTISSVVVTIAYCEMVVDEIVKTLDYLLS